MVRAFFLVSLVYCDRITSTHHQLRKNLLLREFSSNFASVRRIVRIVQLGVCAEGIETIRELKEEFPEAKIIAVLCSSLSPARFVSAALLPPECEQ